mgnify:CR=1 FL=1
MQGTYNLFWLGPVVGNTIDFAWGELELINADLGNQFEREGHDHPHKKTLKGDAIVNVRVNMVPVGLRHE